jgi:hypothetical protein
MEEKWGDYSVDYSLDGKQWSASIRATSEQDAKRRLDRAAAFGKVSGPWKTYHVSVGWWVPAYCWLRNRLAI